MQKQKFKLKEKAQASKTKKKSKSERKETFATFTGTACALKIGKQDFQGVRLVHTTTILQCH